MQELVGLGGEALRSKDVQGEYALNLFLRDRKQCGVNSAASSAVTFEGTGKKGQQRRGRAETFLC